MDPSKTYSVCIQEGLNEWIQAKSIPFVFKGTK